MSNGEPACAPTVSESTQHKVIEHTSEELAQSPGAAPVQSASFDGVTGTPDLRTTGKTLQGELPLAGDRFTHRARCRTGGMSMSERDLSGYEVIEAATFTVDAEVHSGSFWPTCPVPPHAGLGSSRWLPCALENDAHPWSPRARDPRSP